MVLAPNEHLNVMPIHLFRPSGHGRLRNGLISSGERNLLPHEITEVFGLRSAPWSALPGISAASDRVSESISGMDQMLRLPSSLTTSSSPASRDSAGQR